MGSGATSACGGAIRGGSRVNIARLSSGCNVPSVSAARLNVNPRRSPWALKRGPPQLCRRTFAAPPRHHLPGEESCAGKVVWKNWKSGICKCALRPSHEHHMAARNAEVNTNVTANQSSGPGSEATQTASKRRTMTTERNMRVNLWVFKGL